MFKICFSQPNKHILEILLAHRHIFVVQNRRASVKLRHWLLVHHHLIKMSRHDNFGHIEL